jgi:hypothetical protein
VTAGACHVHGSHRPAPLLLHVHHVQPLGMGGPDVETNKVTVCPTGHFNIHTVLAALVFGHPVPKSTQNERHLAEVGYEMWAGAGKPGNPHAAYGLHGPAQEAPVGG